MNGNGGPQIDWREVIELQHERFEERFGRPPRFGEPVFFDPMATSDKPEELRGPKAREALWRVCEEVGMPGHLIHAIRVTGAIPGQPVPQRFIAATLEGWMRHAKKGTEKCECNEGRDIPDQRA